MSEREAPGVRFAEVRFGDTLQLISLRELGDASRWAELIGLNDLVYPYIAEVAAVGVLAYGDTIAVPAATSQISADQTSDGLYGVDIGLKGGALQASGGDFVMASGLSNLNQALRHRVTVDKQDLMFHPGYGCWVRSLLGEGATPSTARLAAMYVKSSLLEDERVQRVESCVATVAGDQVSVAAVVIPVTGDPVNLSVVI
jgi:hypothetical protein